MPSCFGDGVSIVPPAVVVVPDGVDLEEGLTEGVEVMVEGVVAVLEVPPATATHMSKLGLRSEKAEVLNAGFQVRS